ncbi:hypothetical protein ACTXT7_002655, partial [Hymenolepis weldensis]
MDSFSSYAPQMLPFVAHCSLAQLGIFICFVMSLGRSNLSCQSSDLVEYQQIWYKMIIYCRTG